MKRLSVNILMKITKAKDSGKIEIIQVMRGIASLGIVYFHTEYGMWKSANWGVDFFFILSGFFCMYSTENFERINNWKTKYWIAKIKRLCPLYYLMTCVVAIICLLVPSIFRTTIVTWKTFIKSILFLPCYANQGRIYPIYSIGWTMNLEFFFYLVFFISMKLSHRFRGEIALILLGTLISLGNIINVQSAVFVFWTSMRLINFMVGILIYLVYSIIQEKVLKLRTSIIIAVISIGCLFSGYYILQGNFHFLWNTLFGSILLGVCLWGLRDVKCPDILIKIGDMSYSIYMTHFLVIGLVCRVLIDNEVVNLVNTVIIVLAVFAVLLISKLTYELFETRRWRNKNS